MCVLGEGSGGIYVSKLQPNYQNQHVNCNKMGGSAIETSRNSAVSVHTAQHSQPHNTL